MNIIISAADYFNRGKIGDGNQLWADDFEFVYYSDLKSLSYNGTPVDISNPDNIQISALMPFDKSKVVATSGHGASIEYNYDEAEKILKITITGEDNSDSNPNKHEYKVKVNELIPADASEVNGTYDRWIQVNLNGDLASESLNKVEIDGTGSNATFKLAQFNFGTLKIENVEVQDAILTYADEQKKVININAPQQMVNVDQLGEVPITLNGTMTVDGKVLTADLDIPVAPGILEVKVHVGDAPFTTVEENGILKVGGEIKSASIAAFVKGESTANEIDLTGAALAEGLQTSDFSAEANNTLYKISGVQTLDGNNVIKDGVCDNFVLTDGQSFNAPEGFTASHITYNREVKASANGTDEVYTFVLPFTFTADKVNGTVYELTGVNNGVLNFTSVTGKLEANHPYLVVSTGPELLNNEGLYGEVSATDDLTNEVIGGVAMVGAYEATEVKSEGNENWYGYNAKGEFVKANTGTINPFRTAIKSTGSQSSFALKLDGTVTGIVNLENPNAKVDVYTISGVCVRKNVPAASALNGLSRGVYIVGGQKVVK